MAHAAEPRCLPPPQPPSVQQLQAARDGARDHGMLWRLVKDGRESYLFGTVHVGKMQWGFPGPALRQALSRTDVLALELDPTDPAVARQLGSAMRSASLPALPEALRRRLEEQTATACVPAGTWQGVHPLLQVLSLSLLAVREDALDVAYAQESMLADLARAGGRPIVSLESVEQQLGVLLPTDAAQALALVDQALDLLERGRVRPTLGRLAQAWADGDLETLERYADWCECADRDEQRAWLRRLNDERNAHLASGIDALHAKGKRVFAAVGALHMTGPVALPKQLAQRGYTVQRVAFP
ncbi:MAG: TraB/GumN family protein [Rubrivivax sp.]